MTFELEPIENFSSNFVRNICIWKTLFLLKFWSSESETSYTVEAWL